MLQSLILNYVFVYSVANSDISTLHERINLPRFRFRTFCNTR